MRLALLSDIHGNYIALKECLNYIDNNNFDGVVFLGDYITDCPYPQRTLSLIRQTMSKYKTWIIRGNKEEYMLGYRDNPGKWAWSYDSGTGNLLYTYELLTADDLRFFEEMPITDTVKIEGCAPFSICHGSPFAVKEELFAYEENSKQCLDKIDTDYLFCGHTHIPFIFEYNGKLLVNCASVGMPVNGQTDAQFTTAEYINGKWKVKIVSLPYNINGMLCDFEESGIYRIYPWWAKTLAAQIKSGNDYMGKLATRAFGLAHKRNEPPDEKDWERAANELGIIYR